MRLLCITPGVCNFASWAPWGASFFFPRLTTVPRRVPLMSVYSRVQILPLSATEGSHVRGAASRLSGMQYFLPARVSNQFETRGSWSVGVHAIGVRQFRSALRSNFPARSGSRCLVLVWLFGATANIHAGRSPRPFWAVDGVATTGPNRHFSVRYWALSCRGAGRLEARSCAGRRDGPVAVRRAWARPCAGRQHLSNPSLRETCANRNLSKSEKVNRFVMDA